MSRPMNFKEFASLMNLIQMHNNPMSPRNKGYKAVKYVDPVFDMRTNTVFAIQFRTFGETISLHCQNECRDLKESLFERCIAALQPKGEPVVHDESVPAQSDDTGKGQGISDKFPPPRRRREDFIP